MAKTPAGRTQGVHQADGGFQTDKGVVSVWEERTITETLGGVPGTYTMAPVEIPAGATILDIIVIATALWNPGTAAKLIVGDTADPNGFYDDVDLKTGGELEVAEILNFHNITEHAVPGVYLVDATNLRNTYRATATEVTASVLTTGTLGTTGVTRILINYVCPVDLVQPATFVAT